MSTPVPSALKIEGLGLQIGGATILKDVDLDIAPGEFVAVLGPNGAGKTSLLRILLGQSHLSAGTVEVNGRIGYIPQQHADDLHRVIDDLPPELLNQPQDAAPAANWEQALRQWADQALTRGQSSLLDNAVPAFERIMIETALKHTAGRRRDADVAGGCDPARLAQQHRDRQPLDAARRGAVEIMDRGGFGLRHVPSLQRLGQRGRGGRPGRRPRRHRPARTAAARR